MPNVLVASDAFWVRDQVRAALAGPDFEVVEATRGQDVRRLTAEEDPDVVVVDLQIGNMGGMAVSLDLRLEESAGRLDYVPILLLLDREADRFLGRRSNADAMLIKPFDPGTLRRAVKQLVALGEARRQAEEAEVAADESGGLEATAEG